MDEPTSGPSSSIVALVAAIAFLATLSPVRGAGQAERSALALMPLFSPAPLLNRDNAVCLLLDSFRSNSTIKALVVLPGVSDDFYLINRDKPKLNLRATNLLDAITALTNATDLRATFRPPFLLLHTDADRLEPASRIEDPKSVERLKTGRHLAVVKYCDAHWDRIQPDLRMALGQPVDPQARSKDAWHFDRHNVAGWGLTDWELLEAISLSGRTRFTVRRPGIVFDLGEGR